MKVTCPKCSSEAELSRWRLGKLEETATMTCPDCGARFEFNAVQIAKGSPGEELPGEEEPEEVRPPQGSPPPEEAPAQVASGPESGETAAESVRKAVDLVEAGVEPETAVKLTLSGNKVQEDFDDDEEEIILHDIEGFARKSGTDQYGRRWIEWEMDAFAGETPGICDICGKEITSGWLCLDGGEEVCDDHVVFEEDVFETHERLGSGGERRVEEEEEREPDPEYDIVIGPDQRNAWFAGKRIASISGDEEWDDLARKIAEWIVREQYYPDVFMISDHGNSACISDEIFSIVNELEGRGGLGEARLRRRSRRLRGPKRREEEEDR